MMAETPAVGLLATLEAAPGKEQEVAEFLTSGRALVDQEPGTIAWFGVRLGPTMFGIFDVFADDAGRQEHLNGKVAEALMQRAPELFSTSPQIVPLDVLASKLP